MYEHMKNEFMALITGQFTADQLERIGTALDRAAYNYDVIQKETEIVPYGSEPPELVKIYIVSRKIEGLADSTLYNYTRTLKHFFEYIPKKPEQVTTLDIRTFLYQYQKDREISDRSLDHTRITVCAFFKWAHNENYLPTNPGYNIKEIKHERKPRRALSQIEMEYVRRACRTKRELALIETMYSTGCRVSELVGIKMDDLDLINKKVHLYGKGKKHRDSFINGKAEVAIKEYLKERKGESEYLFVSDRSPHLKLKKEAVEKIVREIAEISGIKFTPHILRHTAATTAINNGMPVQSVQAFLGHENINTTMVYAHTDLSIVQNQHLHSVI